MKRLFYRLECAIVVLVFALAGVGIVLHPGLCAGVGALAGIVYLIDKPALARGVQDAKMGGQRRNGASASHVTVNANKESRMAEA